MSITVMEVFRELGLDPDPRQSWAVGQHLQAEFRAKYGAQPPKENRKKTRGPGTHCMAVYPVRWKPKIKAAIAHFAAEATQRAAAQPALF